KRGAIGSKRVVLLAVGRLRQPLLLLHRQVVAEPVVVDGGKESRRVGGSASRVWRLRHADLPVKAIRVEGHALSGVGAALVAGRGRRRGHLVEAVVGHVATAVVEGVTGGRI